MVEYLINVGDRLNEDSIYYLVFCVPDIANIVYAQSVSTRETWMYCCFAKIWDACKSKTYKSVSLTKIDWNWKDSFLKIKDDATELIKSKHATRISLLFWYLYLFLNIVRLASV